jgi:dTDP-4-dehydrorhamnose 3,5-epimerase
MEANSMNEKTYETFKNLSDLRLYKFKNFADNRGSFQETYNHSWFGWEKEFEVLQQNTSYNKKYVLRGLHYQLKNPQGKLVSVFQGSVIDFVIDLRKDSPTYLNTGIFELSTENLNYLYVPPGYAHGFLVLEDNTIFNYGVTKSLWQKDDEYCVDFWSVDEFANYLFPMRNQIIQADKDRMGTDVAQAVHYG